VDKIVFLVAYIKARDKALTASNIEKSWKKSGLHPFLHHWLLRSIQSFLLSSNYLRQLLMLGTAIVSSTNDEIIFKLRQEYRPKLMPAYKAVNSLVTLSL
jgi:hypothetical protein